MPSRGGAVHVVTTSRQYKGRTYQSHLLRRSYRGGGKGRHETVGNLSPLPTPVIDLIRRALRGEQLAPAAEVFEITKSTPHGDVGAVLQTMRRLGLAALLSSRRCKEADLVMGMLAAPIVAPHTNLATTPWAQNRALVEELNLTHSDEDYFY